MPRRPYCGAMWIILVWFRLREIQARQEGAQSGAHLRMTEKIGATNEAQDGDEAERTKKGLRRFLAGTQWEPKKCAAA
jgi:hypothetical protein